MAGSAGRLQAHAFKAFAISARKNSGVELGEQPTPKRASYKYGGWRAREKYMSAQDIF
jgi:hypothetical protein